MQNQKNPNHLHHQFIRKPKRKPSPKQKDQNVFNFKCVHTKNNNLKSKEEYSVHQRSQKQIKSQQDIVLDLKNQLSYLKDQMSKIVNFKGENAKDEPTDNKKTSKQHSQYFQTKPQQNQKSISKQMKKIKSKQRLKFSKIKKSQKFIPLSPKKSLQSLETVTNNNRQKDLNQPPNIQQQSITKLDKKSIDQSTLQEQIKKINQKHKKQLDNKLNKLLQQQNIDNNINNKKNQQNNQQKSKQQKNKLTNANIVHYQIRISKQKKQIKQLQQQIDTLKKDILLKTESLTRKQEQLHTALQQITDLKLQCKIKQIQISNFTKKLSQIVYAKNQIEKKYESLQTQIKKQKLLNNQVKEQYEIIEHKLKNRQMEVIKLQKMLKNNQIKNQKELQDKDLILANLTKQKILCIQKLKQQNQMLIQNIKKQKQTSLQLLKKQIHLKEASYVQQIENLKKLIQQNKNKEKSNNNRIPKTEKQHFSHTNQTKSQKSINQTKVKHEQQSSSININLQLLSPNNNLPPVPPSNPSPKSGTSTSNTSSNSSNKQKQLLQVIKNLQKSIQNYQKDLSFLQAQCKSLHYLKQLSKKQQILIQETNQDILNQQIQRLNSKYTKRKGIDVMQSTKVNYNGK